MAHRVKCPECNGCMAAHWVLPDRYYYCDFCRIYYGGRQGELQIVDNPYLREDKDGNIHLQIDGKRKDAN